MSSARDEILGRVRAAIDGAPAQLETAEPIYRRTGTLNWKARVALFCERASEYRATVLRCEPGEVAALLDGICAERGLQRLFVSALEDWVVRPPGVELVPDDELSVSELDAGGGVLTTCAVAIAETGTIVLDGGRGQGRRALTLVPDLHVCVVPAEHIVAGVPEALEQLRAAAGEGRPLTFVSGPSATSDIELQRVEGVHGPR